MTNIDEPVFLIHNCVNFKQIKKDLPNEFQDINNFDYVQNISSWSNGIFRWKLTTNQQVGTYQYLVDQFIHAKDIIITHVINA